MSENAGGRRSSMGSGAGPDSVTRLTRVEERETLHNLNTRLQFFLSRMKELEARNGELQSKVDTGASAAKAQTESMRTVYERELAELRAAQEKDVELIADLRKRAANNATQAAEAGQIASANKRKAERCDEAEAKLRAVVDERDRALSSLKELESRAERLSQALSIAEEKASLLEKKLAPLREQLSTAEELRRKEASTFRDTIDELTGANRDELARMQVAYDAQLKDALDSAKLRSDAERKAELEQLGVHFHSVEEQLTREIAEQRTAKESALQRSAELAAGQDSLQQRALVAERRAVEAERALADAERARTSEVSSLQAQLESARESRRRKEEEFNELMDVKISLDAELKTYRCLLELEEQRLGITPTAVRSSKKRRRTHAGPKLFVSTLDLTNDCVSVKNAGDESATLGGLGIKSVHNESVVFEFPPEFELQPGMAVTVWSGKKNLKAKRDPLTELWWSPRYMWNDGGDTALLFNLTTKAEVSRLEATANSVAQAPDPDVEEPEPDVEPDVAARQCAIM